ncbi:enoyl-CoA hydratase/isomerase family protein [Plastoroseomonas hellenica]|uniref:enoyl-CoA hydratase/isomerase family protein n=1 Tax=Plastoroseomonas hellenica TaxID=2687306 RepID=UPI001BA9F69E|nr:enoyl-CoA hydratase/isomerase family protein [Plastoroseomonas hellenica]MBR0641504.1 enoyl-CoA hydratase/isomerase family protein [Plastoroseomonas hellenica]
MTDSVLWALSADGVATLTLNRPEARNALNTGLAEALLAGARRAAAEAVKLVVIRANGPVFCAGADLKERKGMSEDQVRARRLKGFAAYDAIERLPMPSIAVVEGPAIGSGVEIAAACDFVVATPQASFRTPEALWGTVGATQRLSRVLGKRLAKDMMFTGRTLTAEEAREGGLVARLVAAEALEAALAEIAATIAAAPPAAMRLAKRCVDEGLERDPRGALATELMAIEESLAEGEWRKTMAGFGTRDA